VTNAEKYIAEVKEKGYKITMTTIVIKAVAEMLKGAPDANGRITFGKFVPYDKVSVSCLVDIDGGKDLAAMTVIDADKMSIEEIADFLKAKG